MIRIVLVEISPGSCVGGLVSGVNIVIAHLAKARGKWVSLKRGLR